MGSFLSKVGNRNWEKMPWSHFKNPFEVAKDLPTFPAIEYLFRLGSLTCLIHAFKTKNLPLYFSGLVCGSSCDIFFMFLPFCDNFWQAQASVMITPRMPFYILELYATFIYIGTVGARQFNLPVIPEAALSGLMAWVIYHVYDINGTRRLWWIWHDADLAISRRHFGAPIGSVMWILTYISIFSFLLRFGEPGRTDISTVLKQLIGMLTKLSSQENLANKLKSFLNSCVDGLKTLLKIQKYVQYDGNGKSNLLMRLFRVSKRIGFAAVVTLPLFMAFMGVFQILSFNQLGAPGLPAYRLNFLTYLAIAFYGLRQASKKGQLFRPLSKETLRANKQLLCYIFFYYAVNIMISKYGNPENHASTSYHQKFSTESNINRDIVGYMREDNIKKEGPVLFSKQDYRLPNSEDKLPSKRKVIFPEKSGINSEWYTIFGKKQTKEERKEHLNRVRLFASIGTLTYSYALLRGVQVP